MFLELLSSYPLARGRFFFGLTSRPTAFVGFQPFHSFFRVHRVAQSVHCSLVALSGSAPLNGAPPPRRRLFVETLAFCGSSLSSAEAHAGRPGQPRSRTHRRRAQRRAQYQRLKDGPAWQTAGEVRRVLTELQKALHQAHKLAPISPINPRIAHQPDSSRGYIQTNSDTSRGREQSHHVMETGMCSDLGPHTDVNVDSCIPEAGTNDATGSAHRRRYGDPSPRVLFCVSSSEHDKIVGGRFDKLRRGNR